MGRDGIILGGDTGAMHVRLGVLVRYGGEVSVRGAGEVQRGVVRVRCSVRSAGKGRCGRL